MKKKPDERMIGTVSVWWPKGLRKFRSIVRRLAEERGTNATKLVRTVFCEWAAENDREAAEVLRDYKRMLEE